MYHSSIPADVIRAETARWFGAEGRSHVSLAGAVYVRTAFFDGALRREVSGEWRDTTPGWLRESRIWNALGEGAGS